MATDTADRPNVEEQYQTAGNTSNLTVEAEKRGSADVIIAAGWSPSRVGMALLRLHSEWDSAAKPRRQNAAAIEAAAGLIRDHDAKERRSAEVRGARYQAPTKPALVRAHELAQAYFVNELRILAVSLKSRPAVWEQLSFWMGRKGIDPDVIAEALLHWLAPTCPQCDGHGFQRVANQPALSNRRCQNNRCLGGTLKPPLGTAPVLTYMDDCVNKARQSLKNRLRRD